MLTRLASAPLRRAVGACHPPQPRGGGRDDADRPRPVLRPRAADRPAAHGGAGRVRSLCGPHRADRRDPGRGREPGDRPHRLARPVAEGRGGPDHLPAEREPARGAGGGERAGEEPVRRELRAGDVRGLGRFLLGAESGQRATRRRRLGAAGRRHAPHGAGRDRAGADLLLRPTAAARRGREPRRTAVVAGLRGPVRVAGGRGGFGGRRHRRVRPAVSGGRGPGQTTVP